MSPTRNLRRILLISALSFAFGLPTAHSAARKGGKPPRATTAPLLDAARSTSSGPEGVTRVKLPNGATLLVKEDPSADVVALNIWVEAGSIDEKADERGMAHLIEHMIFKGTKKRGVGEISREVEAAGGYLNAFTSFEHTCYYVVLPASRVQTALDVEFDAYLHSQFDANELAKEKEVVFEEMRMREDDPWSWSWEIIFDKAFHKNPYHWPVIGDMKILKSVPRESLKKYYETHYVPKNTVVAVVGNVKAAEVVDWVKKNFGTVPSKTPPPRKTGKDPEPTKLTLADEPGDLKQTYATLGFPTVPFDHPDSPALEVLQAVLGDGASSRMNQAIREGSRSADDAGAEHFSGRYGGLFVLQGLTDAKRLNAFLGDAMETVGKVRAGGVDPKELEKIKTRLHSSKIFEKQSMDGMAKSLGYWELQGGYEKEEVFLNALTSVTDADLRRVAAKYLLPKRATLLVYHPEKEKVPGSASSWQKALEGRLAQALAAAPKAKVQEEEAPPVERLALQGGGTLLVRERHGLPIVSLGVFFDGGFPDENSRQFGLTSLMAKCLLKGSGGLDQPGYADAVESLAAQVSPVVEKDYWGLTLDVLTDRFTQSLDLLAQALVQPTFAEGEVAKERDLQKSQIERLPDDPSEFGLLKSDLATFAGTPYAHFQLGEADQVAKFNAGTVRDWYKARIGRKGMTVVVVGDVDAVELKSRLETLFAALPQGPGLSSRSEIPAQPKAGEIREKLGRQQATLVLGLKAPRFDRKDYFTYRVMGALLNGMGARLFIELREKRSLAYSVYATHEALARSGIFQAYVGCAPEKEAKAREELVRVLGTMAEAPVTPEELDRAKTYITGMYQVGLQSSHSQMGSLARYELSGPGAEWVEKYPTMVAKVTAADVQEAAKRIFEKGVRTWVVLSPDGAPGGK